ncbi:hypothetical protein IW148_002925 [Coemansia sp. RSA 1199]|nr:hypothetical protein IW148_002925 [Coemansia sp. RSA 1199]
MPPKNKKKSKKPARDPRAYATTSTPAKARARSRSISKEHKSPTAATSDPPPDTLALPPSSPPAKDPNSVSTWVSIDLAKRQASDRIHHEQTLKSQFSSSPPIVHASARSEDYIVDLIRSGTLSIAPDPLSITQMSVREWTEAANFVIETARAYGFDMFDIEQALDATSGVGGLVDVLAWLCTRVPAERLPVDMRDKLEFGQLQVTVEPLLEMPAASGQRDVEPESTMPILREDSEEADVAATTSEPPIAENSAIELKTITSESYELNGLIAQIRDGDFGVDAYDSDEEDPGLASGRHHVRVSAFEELLDYLRISNQNQQHHAKIKTVTELIKSEKAAIAKLEDDWIYRSERAEAEFNRLWPAFHDQLLDSIRRIKDSCAVEEPEESIVLDDSSGSECGLGAMFAEMLDMDNEPAPDSSSSVAVLRVAPEHGWTGVPIRVLVDQVVHHYDKQAQVRFSTFKASPRGHTGSVRIVWSQPAKAARIVKHQRLLPGADFTVDLLSHCWTMPTDIAGHTSHDARDLAALTLLYVQPDIGHQANMRLPHALREQWQKWEQAEQHKQSQTVEQEHEARVELLQSLHAQYLLATEGHNIETTESAADVPQARHPKRHVQTFTDRAALARKRKWTSTTIAMRQRNDKWTLEFGAARDRLPVTQYQTTIATTFQSNQVLIVRGETGSGKSSQIPQFVLQSLLETGYTGGRVMCTQPRRISTMAIAERVSNELGDPHIGGSSSIVGFQIRMNSKCADENALVFCTTGVLLRMLVDDPDLRSINCVICDEVQERTIEFDYLLIVLRRVLMRRPDLRLVLMSATIDVSLFSMYFDNCPVIDIPGRTFPVRDMFLEDVVHISGYALDPSSVYAAREDTRRAVTADGEHVSYYGDSGMANAWRTINKMRADKVDLDLVCHLVRGMCGSMDNSWATYCRSNVPQGAILVFLPGIYEIRRLAAMLQSDLGISKSMLVVPLHSAFANDRPMDSTLTYQELAFAPTHNVRKIVLATNVAETGITIPDVTVVIDCGLSNQMVYDSRLHISRLQTLPVSRANVRQRQGRAGRVQPGLSLCLFTQHEFHKMREFELPEMQRLPLASLCLLAKAHGVCNVVQFMEQAVEPPRQKAVVHAVVELQAAGALDEDEQLTPIGRYLCYLPVDIAIGKLLVYGATLQCLDSVLTIAAACSLTASLLNVPYDARAKELASQAHAKFAAAMHAKDPVSDHMVSLNIYRAWKQLAMQPHTTRAQLVKFCTENWLNRDAFDMLEDLRERYLRLLYEQGLISYDQPKGSRSVSRLIRPPSSRAFRAGFARAPQSSIVNDSWAVVCAAIVAAMDHTVMPSLNGFVIGQTTVAKRVYGIGAAIQIRDRERIATRPIHLDSLSVVHKFLVTNDTRHAIIATSLSGTSTKVTAHTLSRVHLPLCVLFARSLEYWPKAQLLIVDRWIKCKCRAKTALVLIALRDKVQEILEQRIRNPSVALSEEMQKWMHAVVYYVGHLHR